MNKHRNLAAKTMRLLHECDLILGRTPAMNRLMAEAHQAVMESEAELKDEEMRKGPALRFLAEPEKFWPPTEGLPRFTGG